MYDEMKLGSARDSLNPRFNIQSRLAAAYGRLIHRVDRAQAGAYHEH